MGNVNTVKKYKLERVVRLKEKIEKADNFIFVDYRGLTVEQITELRGELRKVDAELQVVKNSAARIAFKEANLVGTEEFLLGPTALAYCYDEPGPVAKAMVAATKDTSLHLKGALIGSDVYKTEGLEALSKLPGRKELVQMLLRAMQAPVSNLLYALNGVTTKLTRTLVAVAEKRAREEE